MYTQLGRSAKGQTLTAGSGGVAKGKATGKERSDTELRGWLASQQLVPLHVWRAEGVPADRGSLKMLYTAVVFRRQPAAPAR